MKYYENDSRFNGVYSRDNLPNKIKDQKGGFLSMLLGTLYASLLGNLSTGKGTFHAGKINT